MKHKTDYMEMLNKFTVQLDAREPIIFTQGNGCYVEDTTGKKYLDLTSGQVCSIVGHCPPELTDSICQQSKKLIHIHSGFYCEEELLLAKKLAEINDASLTRSIFFNTGGEAIEFALRISKVVTGKFEFISFDRSWHGMTNGSGALTGIPDYKRNGGPFPAGFIHIPTPDSYRCDASVNECFELARQTISNSSSGQVAAMVFEPILAGGGMLMPPREYFEKMRELCDEYEALFIFDECQTGLGRTGSMFAYQDIGIVPDILVTAKGLGSGFPLSAVIVSDRVSELAQKKGFKYLTSHMGDPFVCRMGLETINLIQRKNLVENARKMGALFLTKLRELMKKHKVIGDVRGQGLMIGVEIVQKNSKKPGFKEGEIINRKAMEHGLIINLVVPHNILRIVPPLNISEVEIDHAVTTLDTILVDAFGG
ncbi:MAG: aspartate aminotransferase family protein [Gammaproteobacteria bacterium]|nr:aspartate aminotransferase family protein [Gammaproteobacteria bacterium]